MTVRIIGDLVQASAQDFPKDNARQHWFRLAPYGQKSCVMASGHQFTIDGPGPVVLPADPTAVLGNLEHDRNAGLGHLDQILERPDGVYGRYVAAAGAAGDSALDDIATGRRTGVSVELEAPVIRAGKLLRGFLSHFALVKVPSFDSARVLASASDIGEVTKDLEDAAALLSGALAKLATTDDETDPDESASSEDPTPTEKEKTTVPAALASRPTSATVTATAATASTPVPDALAVLASAQATLSGFGAESVKAAALDQITQGDVFDKASVPAYVGELWKGLRYRPRYLDLLLDAPMVSQEVIGWRWIDGFTPQVAVWTPPSSGTPATMNDIPTNEVKAENVTHKGFRIAGGHAVDRIHTDLPSAEWWASYNQESADDYARKLDGAVIAHLTKPENMTALELSATATTEERILEGIGQMADFCDPDYILLGWDLFVEMALAKKFDQSRASAAGDPSIQYRDGGLWTTYLGLTVKAAPRSQVAQNGRVSLGAKAANELQSLPGGPIRVEAQTITKGLIEHGTFGYHILRDIDKRGMVDVTLAAV